MDAKRRMHHRPFRDYSAHRFRCACRTTGDSHITTDGAQHPPIIVDASLPFPSHPSPPPHPPHTRTTHDTPHTTHTSQAFGWTPGYGRTTDHFAIIRPISFAVYFGQPMWNTLHHIGPNTYPPLSIPLPNLPLLHPTLPTAPPHTTHTHTQHKTHHTPHTHHMY